MFEFRQRWQVLRKTTHLRFNLLAIAVGKCAFTTGAINNPVTMSNLIWQVELNHLAAIALTEPHERGKSILELVEPGDVEVGPESCAEHAGAFLRNRFDLQNIVG